MAESNYMYAYRRACEALAGETDPGAVARRAACRFDRQGSFFEVPFLGRLYRVSYPAGEVTPGEPLDEAPGTADAPSGESLLTKSILILHYLTKATGLPLAGDWTAFRELPGGDIYVSPFTNRTIRPLVKTFGETPDALASAAESLGGRREAFGHASASVKVFERFPVCFVVWQGDEEVPSSGQVLFDRSAAAYLDTEDIVVAAAEALYALRSAASRDACECGTGPLEPS